MGNTRIINSEKLWTSYYILMLTIGLLIGTTNNMLNTTLSLYVNHIGGTNSIAGLVMAAFPIAALLFRPVSGNLLDSRGRRLVLVIGTAVVAFSTMLYCFSYTIVILLILRVVHGAGFSANTTAAGTVVSDIVPRSRLSEGIGYFGISNTIATAIGPSLALFIVGKFSYYILFASIFVLSILALACAIFVNYEVKDKKQEVIPQNQEVNSSANTEQVHRKASFLEKSSVPAAFVMMLLALPLAGIITFLPSYALTRGIKDIGIYFTVYAAALFVSRLCVGKVADRIGSTKVIVPGMALLVIALFILAYAASLPVFLISAVFYGLGFGTAQPTINTIIVRLSPADRRGAANATFYCAMDIGIGAGSILWGFVSQKFSFTHVYIGSALCVVLSIMSYFLIVHKSVQKLNSAPVQAAA